MNSDSRRSKITPQTREESRKLKALWEAKLPRLSQEKFGQEYGIGNQSAVAQFLGGGTPLSLNAARGFALYLGCRIEDFSPRLAEEAAGIASAVPGGGISAEAAQVARELDALEPAQREKALQLVEHLLQVLRAPAGEPVDLTQPDASHG